MTVACHGKQSGNVTLTSLVVAISSVKVHRSGALDLTGEWISLSDTPQTVDLFQLKTTTQLGSTSVEEGTINIVRIDVSGATASSDKGPIDLVVSGNHLQAEPAASVNGGMTTNITVTPHVVCEGNGTFRLTPELTATSHESRD
ncbi:DUF4382 domain-containing protein [Candidatus Bathyarchaeota archaeon]|nr:DUF4382 domain-containing protein [Candidatus Bathyarchaeota archaeon]